MMLEPDNNTIDTNNSNVGRCGREEEEEADVIVLMTNIPESLVGDRDRDT